MKTPYSDSIIFDRILGSLVGGAVGDALGYAVEFMTESEIYEQYGEPGITRYELGDNGLANFSDDTQMSLFTAAGCVLSSDYKYSLPISEYCKKTYLDWLYTQWHSASQMRSPNEASSWLMSIPNLYKKRDPGDSCLQQLVALRDGTDCYSNSPCCGGVMRTAPIASFCVLHGNGEHDDNEAAMAARITHKNPLGFMPSAVLHDILKATLCSKYSGRDVIESAAVEALARLPKIKSYEDNDLTYGELWPRQVNILKEKVSYAIVHARNNVPDIVGIHYLGEGWTGPEALAIGLFCALKHAECFEDAIIAAVNHSGDSDSTGALTGTILGSMYGFSTIPDYFLNDLECLDVLIDMAIDLYNGKTTRR